MRKVVILGAGRGTRMQREATDSRLDEAQRRMADLGLKALIPIQGRAFLDYVLSAVADAGFSEVCLVVAPDSALIRDYYARRPPRRMRLNFAVQQEPLGSADALLAAARFAAAGPFLLLNADNYYPAEVLRSLRSLEGSGLAGFDRDVLVSKGNVPLQRIAAYALLTTDEHGMLTRIIEKPDPATLQSLSACSLVSMTCWRFGPSIFEACRAIATSVRGEYELPSAVSYAIEQLATPFRVVPSDQPVLDLSWRSDIAPVAEWLQREAVSCEP